MPMKILPHTKLKITFQELGALMGTHALLKHGVLAWHTENNGADIKAAERGVHVFNMGTTHSNVGHCGSVGCIGGKMAVFMNKDPFRYVYEKWDSDASPVLQDMFYPPRVYSYDSITAKQAVKVIELFLATGKVRWEKVLTKRNLNKKG